MTRTKEPYPVKTTKKKGLNQKTSLRKQKAHIGNKYVLGYRIPNTKNKKGLISKDINIYDYLMEASEHYVKNNFDNAKLLMSFKL